MAVDHPAWVLARSPGDPEPHIWHRASLEALCGEHAVQLIPLNDPDPPICPECLKELDARA